MNLVNLSYDSTNYYLLADSRPRLLIDSGFPGTLPKLEHQCRRMGVRLPDIGHFLATHYHPDHAGLANELQQLGCKLVVLESQVDAVPRLASFLKPPFSELKIDLSATLLLTFAESRAFLARLAISGEIIPTPGHSDDSISLILNDGSAFTGDLSHPLTLPDDPHDLDRRSWARIRAHNVTRIYPGHGPVWTLE